MRVTHRVVVAALVGLAAAGALAAPPAEPFETLTAEQVSQLMGSPGVHLYDINSPRVYAKGHLPGAVLLTYEDLDRRNLPEDKGATLVFYCKNPG